MKYIDMHVHTSSSPDSDLQAGKVCRMANEGSVEAIGFVAHLDMHPLDFCHGGFDENVYMEEIDQAERETGPRIMRGIEIGEPHLFMESAEKLFSIGRYDFVTGALHWIGDEMILGEDPFLKAADPMELIEEYYRQNLQMAAENRIDVLAHLGIFRRGMARAGLSAELDEVKLFPGLITELFSALIDNGIALELNTSGLRRPERVTYPAAPVIRKYYESGGMRVTLGSDTHREEHAFFGLSRGARLLSEAGFGAAGFFLGRAYHSYPLRDEPCGS